MHYLGVRDERGLTIVSARIYLRTEIRDAPKSLFVGAAIEAGQWDIPLDSMSVEEVVNALVSKDGLALPGINRLRLPLDTEQEVFVAPPNLLHPEGLSVGNRLAVLGLVGGTCEHLVPQPESDWVVKASSTPFDSIQEVCFDYGLNALRQPRAIVEVVAGTAVEVLATSAVAGTSATLGLWVAGSLDKTKCRIGFRVLDRGKVHTRGSVSGEMLTWRKEGIALIGTTTLAIPAASIIQCIASYEGHAHHLQWLADPANFQNPRNAVLTLVDQGLQTLRAYLQPERPLRSRAADDFEDAIGWLLWVLGFSTATFGTNAKTRDAFDTVAVSPNGDFLVVECTLGLLRADSKLSKLVARAAKLRELLQASNMKHLRVLPVIVTSMSLEEVGADVSSAEAMGVLVMTRENLEDSLSEAMRWPDANRLFDRGIKTVQDKRLAQTQVKPPNP